MTPAHRLALGFLAAPVVAGLCLLGGKVSHDFGAEGVILAIIFLMGVRQ